MPYAGELATAPYHLCTTGTSNVSFTTTETVTDTLTFSMFSGKTYTVRFLSLWSSTVANDKITCRLREDNLVGAEFFNNTMQIVNTAMQLMVPMEIDYVAGSTGSKTFVVTGVRYSGSGTCTRAAGASFPSKFTVDRTI